MLPMSLNLLSLPTRAYLFSQEVQWVGLVFGMGLLSLGLTMGASLACSYAIDSYKAIRCVLVFVDIQEPLTSEY